jgi:hypothetical protein
MVRNFLASVAGVAVAIACVSGFDMLSHSMSPAPAGLDMNDMAALAAYVESTPVTAKLIIAAGWFVAPFLGALVAIAIARDNLPGWIAASVFLAAATFNIVLIPHPQWLVLACFILPGLGAMLAQLVMSGRVAD